MISKSFNEKTPSRKGGIFSSLRRKVAANDDASSSVMSQLEYCDNDWELLPWLESLEQGEPTQIPTEKPNKKRDTTPQSKEAMTDVIYVE